MKKKHYSPVLSRFVVSALYHEARSQKLPMTVLADQILTNGLKRTHGWQTAESSQVSENAPPTRPVG
jgi:hypothetical protein